jgi:hypothetical protein
VHDLALLSDRELSAELIRCGAQVERAQARQAEIAGEWLARRAWEADLATSATAWLVERTRTTRPAAARLCRTARLVDEHELTAAALEAGHVSVAHVEVLAAAVQRREALYPEYEETLLNAASGLIPDDLVTVAKRWRALADDELATIDAATVHEQRFLHVSRTIGGMRIDGFLDPVSGATVVNALEHLSPPDPAGAPDARPLSVRYADAFVTMAEHVLDDPERGGAAQPNVDLVLDARTLLDRTGLDAGEGRCDLDGYGPVARVVAERLLCDAKVARIVMGGESRVLDLGRSTRVVSPALRKAITRRDGHCRFRGCRVPAKWCDVHHVQHWLDGGATDLDNLVLLCRRHHAAHHEGGWGFVRGPDGSLAPDPSRTVRPRGRIRRRRQSRPGRSDL